MACFPRLYAAASLKRTIPRCGLPVCACGRLAFPRLYAAASLKLAWYPMDASATDALRLPFSAALCRGLIEAIPATVGAFYVP